MRLHFFLLLFFAFLPKGQAYNGYEAKDGGEKNSAAYREVQSLLNKSEEYSHMQLDSAALYAERALIEAKKVDHKPQMAHARIRRAYIHILNEELKEAGHLLDEAEKWLSQENVPALTALLHENRGRSIKNQPDSALFHYRLSLKIADEAGLPDQIIRSKIRILLILLHQKRHEEFSEHLNYLIPELERKNDIDGLAETYTYMSLAFRDLNEEGKSLLYAQKAIDLSRNSAKRRLRAVVTGTIGSGVINYFKTFEEAEPLIAESLQLAVQTNDRSLIRNTHKRRALLYYNKDDFARATVIIDSLLKDSTDPDVFKLKGNLLSEEGKYREAARYYDKAYALFEQDGAYVQQKMILQFKIDDKLAMLNDEQLTRDFRLLEEITEVLHNAESKSQFFDLETRYRTAEKEAEIRKKELDLAQLRTRYLLVSGAALLLLLTGVFGMWYLRNRQKQRELEYSNSMLSLRNALSVRELESLNSQLNPHEIKNLIASIAPELISKAPEAYKKMIKLFNVTRASLNDRLTESLDVQIGQIEDYLQLQQGMSASQWTFEIEHETGEGEIELPRLLLKNMVENAVKYGVSSCEQEGKIQIAITRDDKDLQIEVRDNGKGIKETAGSTGKGLSTYQRLFELMNRKNNRPASIRLERQGKWTVSCIRIPLEYEYYNQ